MSHDSDVKIGLPTIWAIGVGSVLGGDFFGWQFVTYGGMLSAIISVLIAALFYWLYAGAITELAARYRTTGGAFDFVRRALGEKPATIMAILELLKLILANAALALAISSYLVQAGMPKFLQILCWLTTYGSFTFLDSIGVRHSATAQIIATSLCLLILFFYCISALTKFDINNITSPKDLSRDGLFGFFKGFPFALQFFDGFEETPLLMEYAENPGVVIPKSVRYSYISVTVVAFAILFCGCGITPLDELLQSEAPLMDGIDLVFGRGPLSDVIAICIVLGLLVNFFAFVLFCSQQVQAIAQAGHLPASLAYRHPEHGAPILASIASSCVGVLLCMGFSALFDESQAQNTLVTAALMPAVLGYFLLLECIVAIRNIEAKQQVPDLTGGGVDYHQPNAHNNSLDINTGGATGREEITSKEAYVLGMEPEIGLRFPYGVAVIRLAQGICIMFMIGLFCLATVAVDFMWGIIIIVIMSVLLFVLMNFFATKNAHENRLHTLLDDAYNNQMTSDDMVSNRSEYMGGNHDDDIVVVAMHNPVFSSATATSSSMGPYRGNVSGGSVGTAAGRSREGQHSATILSTLGGVGKRPTKIELKRRDEDDDDITL